MYAVPAWWWGLTSEGDKALIERLYDRLQRMGYLPQDAPGALALVERADNRFFRSIQQNPVHVFNHLLPPTVQHRYGLRPRPHNYILSPKDEKHFIPRHLYKLTSKGPSIKYVTLFLANFDHPSPCHTLSHIPGPPQSTSHISNPRFLVVLVQKNPDKSPMYKFSLTCSRGLLSVCFCQRVFCLEGSVRGGFCPYPLLSECICYIIKFKITLNFMFHMYDKKNLSVTSHALYPLPLSQAVTLSRTSPRA